MSFSVRTVSNSYRLLRFVVTDMPVGWNDYDRAWRRIAEFPIAPGYSEEDQQRRAYEYCDYLNKNIPVLPPIGT